MPVRRDERSTYRAGTEAQTPRQPLSQEEPMRRYSYPIPARPASADDSSGTELSQILEQLSCQSQLLVDLLGAVNSLTAATLARGDKT